MRGPMCPPSRPASRSLSAFFSLAVLATTFVARADDTPVPLGAPPPDPTALVTAPAARDVPAAYKRVPTTTTTATVSAGGQATTGNAKMLAATVNAKFDLRRANDGFGASLLANYGQSEVQGTQTGEHVTTQNIEGRLRYDRYFGERFSVFGIVTGRNDRFQGLAFRLNLDPGAKYLFVADDRTTLWGELGYDYEFAYRLDSSSVDLDPPIHRKVADHSMRAFVGLKHAFNKEVTLATGLEWLQGFVKSTEDHLDFDTRLNFDALLAANLGAGLAIGVGFTALWTDNPLPGKTGLDTTSTVSVIYSMASAAPQPAPAPPPPAH